MTEEIHVANDLDNSILAKKAKNLSISDLSELDPVDNRKSLYGKALVGQFGHYFALFSYNTLICVYDANTRILHINDYFNYSRTTKRHQRAFLSYVLNYIVTPEVERHTLVFN